MNGQDGWPSVEPAVLEEGRDRPPLRPYGTHPAAPEGMPLGVHVVWGPTGWGKTHRLCTKAVAAEYALDGRSAETWSFDGRRTRRHAADWHKVLSRPPRTDWADLDELLAQLRERLVPEHPRAEVPLLVLLDHLSPHGDGLAHPTLITTLGAFLELTPRPIGVMVSTRTLAAFGESDRVDRLLAGSTLTQVGRYRRQPATGQASATDEDRHRKEDA